MSVLEHVTRLALDSPIHREGCGCTLLGDDEKELA